jgi:long-subunit fatty acid transport protein
MKKLLLAGAACLTATPALAGGLDRSGQSIGIIFEEGRWAEFSLGFVAPSLSGTDVLGGDTGDVGNAYLLPGIGYKADLNSQVSYALIYDQPYGADVLYGSGSALLGGTSAEAASHALTGILRYKMSERFSVHGGLRLQAIDAAVTLSGLAYGGLSGYSVDFDTGFGVGALAGVAYEIPDIALRVALTYNSAISHDLATTENFFPIPGNETTIVSPQSVNIDFQTGIMADTLLFGSIRWVDWSEFDVTPPGFGSVAGALVEYDEDTITYNLGVGRRFSDSWSGAIQVGYEAGGDPLVSPLGPTNGFWSVGAGATYTQGNSEITAGLRYVFVGDAQPETGTPDTPRATFSGNHALALGIKYGIKL